MTEYEIAEHDARMRMQAAWAAMGPIAQEHGFDLCIVTEPCGDGTAGVSKH